MSSSEKLLELLTPLLSKVSILRADTEFDTKADVIGPDVSKADILRVEHEKISNRVISTIISFFNFGPLNSGVANIV